MKYIFLFLLLASCLFTSVVKGQSTNSEVGYSGGPTSLGNEIYRYLNVTYLIIESDYLLFFEVSLNSKGKITAIKPFHTIQDSIAKRVYEALHKTSNWRNTTKATQKVLVPIFLIRDKE